MHQPVAHTFTAGAKPIPTLVSDCWYKRQRKFHISSEERRTYSVPRSMHSEFRACIVSRSRDCDLSSCGEGTAQLLLAESSDTRSYFYAARKATRSPSAFAT